MARWKAVKKNGRRTVKEAWLAEKGLTDQTAQAETDTQKALSESTGTP